MRRRTSVRERCSSANPDRLRLKPPKTFASERMRYFEPIGPYVLNLRSAYAIEASFTQAMPKAPPTPVPVVNSHSPVER